MTFLIPNLASATYEPQAEPDSGDFRILANGIAGTGVVSGCAVTAQAAPDMTLAVASGSVAVDGIQAAVTAGNVAIGAADATNPRFDLVVVNGAGAKSVLAGTAAATPAFPAVGTANVVLAAVYVPAAATAIAGGSLIDKRAMIRLGGGTSGTGYDPDAVPSSPTAEDDEFDDAAIAAKWGWSSGVQPTLVSESARSGRLMMQVQPAATAAYFRQAYVPGAGVAFTVVAKVSVAAKFSDNCSIAFGVAVLDAADAPIARFGILSDGATTVVSNHRVYDGTTAQSISTGFSTPVYVGISRDTANVYRLAWSLDGLAWNVFSTPTSATVVSRIGLWLLNSAGTADRFVFADWFRRSPGSSFPFTPGRS